MRAEDFEYLYKLEADYWWFVAMREITDAIVSRQLATTPLTILDAGCGTGFNLGHYEQLGHRVFGFDIAPEAVDWVVERGFTRIAQASVTEIPFASDSFDLVFSFDVLVQMPVEMSNQGMREMFRVLKPGGFLFARTAAYEWMRSSHDEELHTMHRFTLGELQEKLLGTGFKIRQATYANTFLFPLVVVRRFLKRFGIGRGTDVKPLPPALSWVDPIFREVLRLESHFAGRRLALPFGLSAICYAEKPRIQAVKD
jgi:SAM-dependent methyltransferase